MTASSSSVTTLASHGVRSSAIGMHSNGSAEGILVSSSSQKIPWPTEPLETRLAISVSVSPTTE